MSTAKKLSPRKDTTKLEPVLHKVLKEAKREHQQLQETFELMGWGELPDALKIEIKDDVKAMVDELEGKYSSCDPHVARRRRRVVHWVNSFLDGICSLDTAIDVLRVNEL